MISHPFIILETTLKNKENKTSYVFKDFDEVLIFTAKDDPVLFFNRAQNYLRRGYWLAGFFTYEFGYFLDIALADLRSNFNFPLAWLGVCRKPQIKVTGHGPQATGKYGKQIPIKDVRTNITKKEYYNAIAEIKKYLERGLTYQVNYTFKLKFAVEGDVFVLYRQLKEKQPTNYSAFVNTGKDYIISLSPELFFRVDKNNITTRPIKGTLPHGNNKEKFIGDAKTRAENIMIVDLLRNDLGKIAASGTVKAEKLFCVEEYPTLYQMSSTISAVLKKKIILKDIFYALFPCGSVTGAPKIRTMKIIETLEKEPRNIYTGAIGYINPSGGACFNVAIRTILVSGNKGELGIGGGVVYDSFASREYNEALLKARFFTDYVGNI